MTRVESCSKFAINVNLKTENRSIEDYFALAHRTVPESWNISTTEHVMLTIKASAVSDITKICLKIDADKIINDIKRRQIPR